MDFLDPRKRRRHRRQLMIGYALVSIAILLGAIILVYSADGFGISTKTGDVVQNGLLFLDSQPGGAEIYLNGKDHNAKTASRLILPAANYTVTLKRTGYRDWTRSFTLTEHAISRYVYPFLFPVKPTPVMVKSYPSTPGLITESPDRHWLLVQVPGAAGTAPVFEEFDITNVKFPAKELAFPDGLLTGPTGTGSQLKVVEWSTDNKNVLLQHTYPGGDEFIVFNRDTPSDSFNVNKVLATNPTQVALRNKKVDQLYLYNQSTGSLLLGDISTGDVTPVLSHVLAFKPNGSDLILYVTEQDAPTGQVWARIWDNSKTYPLYSFAKGDHYLIDMAQYQSDWYYVAGSDQSNRINIYKNPLDGLTNTAIGKALPLMSLTAPGADKLSFSANTRFIEAESGQTLAVYDFETQTGYHYNLTRPLAADLNWMDGHRLAGDSQNEVFVTDYDSTNQQILVPTVSGDSILFDANYQHLFTLAPAPDGSTALYSTDLRAGVDLPKQ